MNNVIPTAYEDSLSEVVKSITDKLGTMTTFFSIKLASIQKL